MLKKFMLSIRFVLCVPFAVAAIGLLFFLGMIDEMIEERKKQKSVDSHLV